MDISSIAYQRAISVLTKQNNCPPHGLVSCSKLDSEIFQTLANLGLSLCSSLFHVILTFCVFLDILSNIFTPIDRETIRRACDIVSNSTMAELSAEDIRAKEALHDALCHQIVAICLQLCVALEVVDHLMDLYNQSIAANNSKAPA